MQALWKEGKVGMIRVKEGDIVHINMELAYHGYKNEYDAIVLWNFGRQPLLTRVGQYKPFWATYDEIERVIGHIDMEKAVKCNG